MMKKVLALDIGEKRVGIAISDLLGMMAHPLQTLVFRGINDLSETLNRLVQEHDAGCVVVGVPYTMKGTKSKKTEEVLEIVAQLKALLPVKIEEIDERLTTRMAERDFHALNKKPSKNRKTIDQIAAVYILQTYLDKVKVNL